MTCLRISSNGRPLVASVVFVLCGLIASVTADDADPAAATGSPTDFTRDVAPIFARHCLECHGNQEPEGGLRLTSRANALLRGDSGERSLVPGDSRGSELIRRITAGEDERMPPEGDGLSVSEIATLRRWIDAGAVWPEQNEQPQHWAYVAPVRAAIPQTQHPDWVRNAIDAFVLRKLSAQQPALEPSQPATPAKLLRRVYLDLVGLPPSVEELDAFLADPSPEHYEQIVDRLLKSPRYGEKWARQWLDLARYADSNGFQADQFRSMWAYRDWIIRAMNDDMPFDQFTIEQIAGDLLPDATIEQRIATGFQRCTTCNVEAGVDPEENRVNQIVDRVNTLGAVWLGTTLECAQCHNHKYDPFTQQDYYQLFAFFNNTPLEVVQPNGSGVQFEVSGPKMALPLAPQQEQQRERLLAEQAGIDSRISLRKDELASLRDQWEANLQESLDSLPVWHEVEIASFDSAGGATYERQEDRSLLVTGPNPAKDTYTLTIETELHQITGLKIEMLADESLPRNGPGRGTPNPNAIITDLELESAPAKGGDAQPVRLHSAAADFSQKNWDVGGAIDADTKTGWAINPQFGKDHWATFLTGRPLGASGGTRLTVRLHQNYGGSRTIGRLRVSLMTGDPGAAALPNDVGEILAIDPATRSKKQSRRLALHHEQSDADLAKLQQERKTVSDKLATIQPDTTLVMVEMDEPRQTMIFRRGNFLDPLAEVEPTMPAALHHDSGDPSTNGPANRLTLARWLVSSDNPLVARVTVNRWWAEFFGQGLVGTIEDFGAQGDPPTHPELLDWLAVEFVESGWSMKEIHRLIVTSATYQQDSAVSARLLKQDPYNQLLTRGPRFRLPAEAIRDNALAIAGLLSTKMGGPPVYPPQPPKVWRHVGRNAPKYETDTDEDRFRRGIYVVWRRSAPYPSFVNFDAPDRGACVVNRSRTNTPLQALTLLNDPAYVEMAVALARRLDSDSAAESDRARIEYGFRLCTSRQPTSDEVETLLALLRAEHERFKADPSAAMKLVGEATDAAEVARLAAWMCVANALLNLDETVTKG